MSAFSEDGLRDILNVLEEDSFDYQLTIENDERDNMKIWYLVYDNPKTKQKYRMCTMYEATDGSYDGALMAEIFVSTKELLKFLLNSFFDNRQNYKKAAATNSMMQLLLLDVFNNAKESADKKLVESLEPIFALFNITGLANLFDNDLTDKTNNKPIHVDSHIAVVSNEDEVTVQAIDEIVSPNVELEHTEDNFA